MTENLGSVKPTFSELEALFRVYWAQYLAEEAQKASRQTDGVSSQQPGMASSRVMRNSPRTASPAATATNNVGTPEVATSRATEGKNLTDGWHEPPLRPPAPSFEDYRGLERHGVLEHMAPLGSLPSQKVKQRVKVTEPSRRSLLGKQVEAVSSSKEPTAAPEPPAPARRRSESRKVEERSPDKAHKLHTQRGKHDDGDYTPKAGPSKPPAPKLTSRRNSVVPSQETKYSESPEKLKAVVESALERSREVGNEALGMALMKVYEDSLSDPNLGEILDAVLNQRSTPKQAQDFQTYIKVAKKSLRGGSASRRSSLAAQMSPTPNSAAPQLITHSPGTRQPPLPSTEIDIPSHPSTRLTYHNSKVNSTSNGDIDHRPTKRVKRSKSVSSTSSLSSLSSMDPGADSDKDYTSAAARSSKAAAMQLRQSNGPRLGKFTTGQVNSKRPGTSTPQPVVPAEPALTDEELLERRRKLRRSFDDVKINESSVRTVVKPLAQGPYRSGNATPSSLTFPSSTRTGRGSKREDDDDQRSSASSTQGDFLIPPPPGMQRPSRGATPNQFVLGPKKDGRKGARIKHSPMKKKNGVVAGIAQKNGGKDGPVGYGHADDGGELDNSDTCTACGGNGQLLCCDGCPRSYHFKCLDPPMNPHHPPEGEWYCHYCVSKRDGQPTQPEGVFAGLLSNLGRQNPIAFHLPPDMRTYFEHVETGEDGEYVDTSLVRAKPREATEAVKTTDAKGNVILCYRCEKTADRGRELIACDFCNNKVHLDCLDPPLTHPPSANLKWKCPAHCEQELLNFIQPGGERLVKVRRPKKPFPIASSLRRGIKNNGMIEIINSDTDEEEDPQIYGGVYQVTERALKLDFIDRCKRDLASAVRQLSTSNPLKRKRNSEHELSFRDLEPVAQEAALGLLSLSIPKPPTAATTAAEPGRAEAPPTTEIALAAPAAPANRSLKSRLLPRQPSKAPAAITDTPQVTLTPDGKVQLPNATSLTEEQKQAVAKIEEELAVLRRSIGSTD